MKRSLLLIAAFACGISTAFTQVTSVTVETFYTDDSSVSNYPAGHTTYRVYANCTNQDDRVTAISGNDDAPLILNVPDGVWNHPLGGVVGNDGNCSAYGPLPALEYDSYVTLDYTCQDGDNNTVYALEDPAQPWMSAMFDTPNGSTDILLNTSIGGGWFGIPDADSPGTDNTRAGADLRVLIAQITTSGTICGIVNIQCFPNYDDADDDYIIQTGFQFGTIDCGIPGCTDATALNYNSDAEFDNGLCLFECGLNIDSLAVVDPTCSYNNDGSIYFTGAGEQDYIEYSFEGDVIGLTPEMQMDLGNGTYTISLHDTRFDNENVNPGGIYGTCTITQQVDLFTEAIMLDEITVGDVTCAGDADGCASLAVFTGGTGDFDYTLEYLNGTAVLDGNNDPLALTEPSYCGLNGGFYHFVATDENGCEAESENFEVVEPNTLALFEGAELAASCFNSADATQVFTFAGGTGDIDFELDNSGDFELEGGGFNLILDNLTPGDYTLYAMDATGCTAEANFSVAGGPAIMITSLVTQPSCNGETNGMISISAEGGTGDFTYSFDGVLYNDSTGMDSLAMGTYTVYAMDENGCIATQEVMVNEPDMLMATVVSNDISCNGETDGSVTINATGGTELYAYSINGIDFTPSPTFNDLGAATYDVWVMDANGCGYFMEAGGLVEEPEAITATAVATGVSCNGDDDGQIEVTAEGGTGELEYSTGTGFNAANPITGLDPDTYEVTVMDENGCEYIVGDVEVTEPSEISISGLTNDNINDTPGGNSDYDVTGGTGDYTYSWTLNGDEIATTQNLPDLTLTSDAGTYMLTVTDENGCEASQSITITGIGELGESYSINIYPNPSNGMFLMNIAGTNGAKMTYSIADEAGRIVISKELGNVAGARTETIDATMCAAGIYNMIIVVGTSIHTTKLVIE